jgi:7,8-dihydropterin-6-yl-methyl-4-(beta-D-ribofuranosyl)aminobenzene 5'-phosphate synthase
MFSFKPRGLLFACGVAVSFCLEGALSAAAAGLTSTILFDNHPFRQGMITGNGFSCLIQGAQKTILFDTGPDGKALLGNMNMMGVNPKDIDSVVISHAHDDHIGGLISFLEVNHGVSVFVPPGLPADQLRQITGYGVEMITVDKTVSICRGVYSIVGSGAGLTEQSLVINTRRGLILISGCAHPGITNIIATAVNLFRKPVIFVYGGFHLKNASEERIRGIINQFISLGVKMVGGAHCTGLKAMQLFKEVYGRNYIQMGAGKVVSLQ